MEPSWWSLERGSIGSNGDGVFSPGNTGDITGALTGRVDLLSGVDAMAGADRVERQWPYFKNNTKQKKTYSMY